MTGLFILYNWPSFPPELPIALPIPKPSSVTFCTGVYLCAVFSSKQSIQTLCYRVEYGQQKQKPHNSLCGLGSWREQQQGD